MCFFCCLLPSPSLLLLSCYFKQLLLLFHIFPYAPLTPSSPVGATEGSASPLLAQVSAAGRRVITFTMGPNDGKAFPSEPTQLQI